MNYGIYSYASVDLDDEILFYQRKIFENIGLKINQIIGYALTDDDKYKEHGEYFSEIINRNTEDYFIFFDVDCIPLSIDFLKKIQNDIQDGNTLSGAIGCANHINNMELYVHSCFLGTSKKLFKDCGSPDLKFFENGDTAQRFTQICKQLNKKCIFWNVTNSKDLIWDLIPVNKKFGHGTIYENQIYHQFEIRKQIYQSMYIEKCKSILYHKNDTL